MSQVLLVVDVFSDFKHEDGEALLASVRRRWRAMEAALVTAREGSMHVIFANDTHGVWDGDMRALLQRALEGSGGDVLAPLAPLENEAFVVKPRYSAFDLTPLPLILEQLEIDRVLVMGTATEMCVAQTAIDARERGFEVGVVADACATLSEEKERLALAYLEDVLDIELQHGLLVDAARAG